MRLIHATFFTPIKILVAWLFIIPSRLPIVTFFCCYFLIDLAIGDGPIYLFNRELGVGSPLYFLFWFGLGWPMFFSFVALFSNANSASTPNGINSALDQAINFRNSQLRVSPPKTSFELLKDTSTLDVLQANSDNEIFKSAIQGFNAQHGGDSPTSVFKSLTEKK